MDVVRKKISKTDLTDGGYVYFKINLNQTFDNMGEFSETVFIPAPVLNRVLSIPEKILRLGGAIVSDWYVDGNTISGTTDSKLVSVKGYNVNNPYVVNYDVEEEPYYNYNNQYIDGATRVTNISGNSITYVIDTNRDSNIGTDNQTSGILYRENTGNDTNSSQFRYHGEGWNGRNSSLSALYKEEYLMGINFIPEIENDVFIDRGNISVTDYHLRMSEIETLNHLESYGNGFFKIKFE